MALTEIQKREFTKEEIEIMKDSQELAYLEILKKMQKIGYPNKSDVAIRRYMIENGLKEQIKKLRTKEVILSDGFFFSNDNPKNDWITAIEK